MSGSDLRGDFGRLDRLLVAVRSIRSQPFWRRLLNATSDEVNRQITAGFWYGRDPYGKRWEPLKFRTGQPLMKSGALLRAAQSRVVPPVRAILVSIDLVYAGVQQRGATIRARNAKALRFRAGPGFIFRKSVTIPARPYLPKEGDLPPRWRDGIAGVLENVVVAQLKV